MEQGSEEDQKEQGEEAGQEQKRGKDGGQRQRRARVEEQRDRELTTWLARFRFVTAEVLALRSGVTEQRINCRVRRLVAAEWVARSDERVGHARVISVTRKGCRAIGVPVRRPTRTDRQREHELELAWLVAQLELRGEVTEVRTERESRAREAAGLAPRYSIDVTERGGHREKRWPDLVLEQPGRRVAVEFERTSKGQDRLERTVAATASRPGSTRCSSSPMSPTLRAASPARWRRRPASDSRSRRGPVWMSSAACSSGTRSQLAKGPDRRGRSSSPDGLRRRLKPNEAPRGRASRRARRGAV